MNDVYTYHQIRDAIIKATEPFDKNESMALEQFDKLHPEFKPQSEQESQEELFDELFSIYFARLHEGLSMYAAVKEMETRYTLTRKP